MSAPLLGVLISSILLACFSFLFQLEERRGARYLAKLRESLDAFVIRMNLVRTAAARFIGRRVIRQVIHYLFHRLLTILLRALERSENGVKRILRTNKLIARKLEEDTDRPKNKLGKIAEHKQLVALTESEKKKHRQKSLEG